MATSDSAVQCRLHILLYDFCLGHRTHLSRLDSSAFCRTRCRPFDAFCQQYVSSAYLTSAVSSCSASLMMHAYRVYVVEQRKKNTLVLSDFVFLFCTYNILTSRLYSPAWSLKSLTMYLHSSILCTLTPTSHPHSP